MYNKIYIYIYIYGYINVSIYTYTHIYINHGYIPLNTSNEEEAAKEESNSGLPWDPDLAYIIIYRGYGLGGMG
jgi:hypothetical protein